MASLATAYASCIFLLIYSGLAASHDGSAGSGGDSSGGSAGNSSEGSAGNTSGGSAANTSGASVGDTSGGSAGNASGGYDGDAGGGYTRVLVYGNLTCPHDPIIRAEVWIRQHMAGKYHSIRQYFSDFPPMPRNLLGQAMLKKSQQSFFLRIQPTDGMSSECQSYIRGRINVTQLRHSSLPNTMTYNVGTCDLNVGICSNFLSENVEMPTNPQFIGQRITLAGELICPGGHGHMKAQLLLKSQKHGKVIAMTDYPNAKRSKTPMTGNKDPFQQEGGSPTLLTTGRTEPLSVYLTMTPMEPTKPECSKTIEGSIPMSDFNPPNGPSINFDLGTCDFAIGECSNFARSSHGVRGNSLVIRGSIICPTSRRVEAVALLKKRPNSPNTIKSQIYSNKGHSPKKNVTDDLKSGESGKDGIILEAETSEPVMVFLDITPVRMPSRCQKPIRGKIGMRAFTNVGGKKKVFDVGTCDLSIGHCTSLPPA